MLATIGSELFVDVIRFMICEPNNQYIALFKKTDLFVVSMSSEAW